MSLHALFEVGFWIAGYCWQGIKRFTGVAAADDGYNKGRDNNWKERAATLLATFLRSDPLPV